MNPALRDLERLLTLYEAMSSATEAQDWELLSSRDAERAALTNSLPKDLSACFSPAEQPRARALIEDCLRCEARIRPEIEARLNELRVLLREPQIKPSP